MMLDHHPGLMTKSQVDSTLKSIRKDPSKSGFTRPQRREFLHHLLSTPHCRRAFPAIMSLNDDDFRSLARNVGSRPERLPKGNEMAFLQRAGRLDAISGDLALESLAVAVRGGAPALFDKLLHLAHDHQDGFATNPFPGFRFRIKIFESIESCHDRGTAAILARWIRKNPGLYARGFRETTRDRLKNNPKPALALVSLQGAKIDDEILSFIAQSLAPGSPHAALFGSSAHQDLARHAFSLRHRPEDIIGARLRDLRERLAQDEA